MSNPNQPGNVAVIHLHPVAQAMFQSSPRPRGKFKAYWTMALMARGHKCQLPRGFARGFASKGKPLYVHGKRVSSR